MDPRLVELRSNQLVFDFIQAERLIREDVLLNVKESFVGYRIVVVIHGIPDFVCDYAVDNEGVVGVA